MGTQGRGAAVMHLIRYCSVSDNKCGRLSDSVQLRHVSTGAPACQAARPPGAFFSSTHSAALSALSPPRIPLSSQQITASSPSVLSLLQNCSSSSSPDFQRFPLFLPTLPQLFSFLLRFWRDRLVCPGGA